MITQEQKSNLAKLLATENITVEHKKVKTAYFIPKTRVLCLPIWEDMTNDLYDLLVGHEVGHALYTPTDENEFKKYDIPHSYFNVVEDIRIDKKMKKKYPGLRKSYYNGYNELIEKDFFGTSEIDVNKIRFIDRLNMFAKSGQREIIEFNDIEKEFITRSDNLETWEDVVKLTKDIYAYSQEEQFDEQEQEQLSSVSDDVNFEEGDEEQDMQPQQGDTDEQQEQDQKDTTSSESDNDKSEEEQQSSQSSKEEKEEEKEKEEQKSDVGTAPSGAGYSPDERSGDINESATDNNYQKQSSKLAQLDSKTWDNLYLKYPKVKDAVVPYDIIAQKINDSNADFPMSKRLLVWKKYKNQCMRSVSYMTKEFEMKKRADSYSRTRTSRTGMINTNALHSYKYNDDIFKRIQIEPGAKNHGMVMIIDWSGSMSDKTYDTICQTINLVLFCKSVNIPFEVYAFTDMRKSNFMKSENSGYQRYDGLNSSVFDYGERNLKIMEEVSLLQFVSSDMRIAKFNEAMANLYQIAMYYNLENTRKKRMYRWTDQEDEYEKTIELPYTLRFGGTPFDSAILCTIPVVNKFREKNKVQKMSTIFLTDGCGHTNHNYTDYDKEGKLSHAYGQYETRIVMKDGTFSSVFGSKHSKSLPNTNHFNYHYSSLKYFKYKTNSTVIGYYIAGKSVKYWDVANFNKVEGYEQYEIAKANIRKHKCHSITDIGYDEFFIIPRSQLKVSDENVDINSDMTTAKMKQQFLKNFKTKKVSRVLLNKFIERIA